MEGSPGAGRALSADEKDWLAAAAALATEHGRAPAAAWPRIAARLMSLDALVRGAPKRILNAYARLREPELVTAAEARCAQLEEDIAGWAAPRAGDVAAMLRPVAVEARALDLWLRRRRPKEAPLDPNADWRVADHFVVPCRERRKGKSGRDGQPYERRGLLNHRIIPAQIGLYEVRLAGGDISPGDEGGLVRRLQAGAALFQGLEFDMDAAPPGSFLLRGAAAPDHADQIDAALHAAHEAGCEVVVWPELTIWSPDREQIQAWLEDRLLDSRLDGGLIEVVVAGSCHEPGPESGTWVNRSVVYSAYGERLLAFDKLVAFHDKDLGTENIIESRVLNVLVLEDLMIAFGICRDFADTGADNPLARLDVDMVLVPSMGNQRTLEGHLTTARLVADRFAAVTFVVQQAEPGEADHLGYVVPPQDDLSGLSATSTLQTTRFDTYPKPLRARDRAPKS